MKLLVTASVLGLRRASNGVGPSQQGFLGSLNLAQLNFRLTGEQICVPKSPHLLAVGCVCWHGDVGNGHSY